MKYQVHMKNTEEDFPPSQIPLEVSNRQRAIGEFKRLREAHGSELLLKLNLIEIDGEGNETEIEVP